VVLFTTALDLHGGVLWSGEFQGLVIHELVPKTHRQGQAERDNRPQSRGALFLFEDPIEVSQAEAGNLTNKNHSR
jgi:hypothetical protein